MKTIFSTLLCAFLANQGYGQSPQHTPMPAIPLQITLNKTTSLVFAHQIKSVDKGSRDILAQKVKAAGNVLQLKAARADFAQTNLTVITAEGKLYTFLVDYHQNPKRLHVDLTGSSTDKPVQFDNMLDDEASIRSSAESIDLKAANMKTIRGKKSRMGLDLSGLYIHDDVLYMVFELFNHSHINFQRESLRFFIRDKKRAKRTAVQESEIAPVYIRNDTCCIAGKSSEVFVVAVPKFTIPDKKYLSIQVNEKSGGRHLDIRLPGKTLLNAKPL